jgi:perosamine synthetase
MAILAINGGKPVRSAKKHFPSASPIGKEEVAAASRVVRSGALSKFVGAWDPLFFGGPEVLALEKEWAKKFGVKHAVTTNSATSSLIIALGAMGIEPGDEVIVSPYSMCISATAPLFWGAIPVFADIEPEYFTLDPKSVEKAITSRTKAIIPVDLLGQSHDADAINALAKKHGLKVIADAAQGPGALYKGKYAGTLSDIGVYSLNFHKHIHTGEGSVVVTNNDKYAKRMQLLRNHAEAVVEDMGETNIVNMLGQNYRMTEVTAAIGRSQLKKLDRFVKEYQRHSAYIAGRCMDMPGFRPTRTRPGCTSVHYMQAFSFDELTVGVSREKFVAALRKELPATKGQEEEGTLISGGYVKPIYLMPIFQKQIAIGSRGFPFKSEFYNGNVRYDKGMCPVVEHWYEKEMVTHDNMRHGMTKKDLDDVIEAFHKVYRHRGELR